VAGTVLITLGRLPKALDLARGFNALGYRVIVAEPFRWHLTGVSNVVARRYTVTAPVVDRHRYLQDLLDIVASEKVDLVVPVSEEIMHVSFLRARLPSAVVLYAMPSAALLALHNKLSFIDRCRDYAVSAPESAALGDPRAETIAQQSDYIVKPIFSCSGRGVQFKQRGEALPAALAQQPMLVQTWVKGDVLSTFSVAHAGRVVTSVVYRGAVMSGTVAVCFERVDTAHAQHRPVVDWVNQFVARSGWSGFISFDFIVDRDGFAHGIECNPRATSGLHFLEPRDLAAAVANPAANHAIRFRRHALMQQFYPCLTELQSSMFRGDTFRQNMRYFLRAKDVSWSWRDPLPFLSMPVTASQIIWKSIRHGVTMGEVATLDVGWYNQVNVEDASGEPGDAGDPTAQKSR
jgi:predicted ATP-grasp superfamily ATP-dependent carboligase